MEYFNVSRQELIQADWRTSVLSTHGECSSGIVAGWGLNPSTPVLCLTCSKHDNLCETLSGWFHFHDSTTCLSHLAELGLDAYVLRVDTLGVMAAVNRILSLIQLSSLWCAITARRWPSCGFDLVFFGAGVGWSTVYRWPWSCAVAVWWIFSCQYTHSRAITTGQADPSSSCANIFKAVRSRARMSKWYSSILLFSSVVNGMQKLTIPQSDHHNSWGPRCVLEYVTYIRKQS